MLLGVDHCHSLGVIHRDIKPANLMITTNGTLKLVDFGVAEMLDMFADESQVIGTRTRGSPAFQPPEVASGKGGPGTAIDVWSAGVTLFFAVTGDVPFSGKSVEALYNAIIESPLTLPPWLQDETPELAELIGLMLHKEAKSRPSIDELLHNSWVEDPRGDFLYEPQVTQAWKNTKSVTSKLEGIYGESFVGSAEGSGSEEGGEGLGGLGGLEPPNAVGQPEGEGSQQSEEALIEAMVPPQLNDENRPTPAEHADRHLVGLSPASTSSQQELGPGGRRERNQCVRSGAGAWCDVQKVCAVS